MRPCLGITGSGVYVLCFNVLSSGFWLIKLDVVLLHGAFGSF